MRDLQCDGECEGVGAEASTIRLAILGGRSIFHVKSVMRNDGRWPFQNCDIMPKKRTRRKYPIKREEGWP